MATSFNNPAEFPEGGEGGGGRPRPVGGGPQEYPVFQRAAASYQALVHEILALTVRVQSIELQLQQHRLASPQVRQFGSAARRIYRAAALRGNSTGSGR